MFARNATLSLLSAGLLAIASGCAAPYPGLVRPAPRMGAVSPELENLSEARLRQGKGVKPAFPTTLAIAKVSAVHGEADYSNSVAQQSTLEIPQASEADGWRKLVDVRNASGGPVVRQVQFISRPAGGPVNLQTLRNAASALHAQLLLVYMQVDRSAQGQNKNAPAYWTGVGLLFVPGETVGQYTVAQGVLVDTQTGVIVGTLSGESRREENVTPGNVDKGRQRAAGFTQTDAVTRLQNQAAESLKSLANLPARPAAAAEEPASPARTAPVKATARPAKAPALQTPAARKPALKQRKKVK